MAVERRVTEIAGPPGGKLHTARSRNDQVATDVALFTRDAAGEAAAGMEALVATLLDVAERHADWALPGYTHLQRAQPVYLAHHLLAYVVDAPARPRADALRRRADGHASARRGSAGGGELLHRPRRGGGGARLRGRRAELDRRRLQPRLRPGLPERRGDVRDAPLPAGGGDRAVGERGVRLPAR